LGKEEKRVAQAAEASRLTIADLKKTSHPEYEAHPGGVTSVPQYANFVVETPLGVSHYVLYHNMAVCKKNLAVFK
jgi:hypothetical protein